MQPGDLFLAPFHYADLAQTKRRPVCVVSAERLNYGPDVIVTLVSAEVRELCEAEIEFVERGPFALKGFDEPMPLYDVAWHA